MQRMIFLAEDDDPGRGSWSWQKNMFLAEDHDPGRETCSCQNNMVLLGNKEPLLKGPPWDHLGTIFGQIRKLISCHSWIDLGSIRLLEAGLDRISDWVTKCRLSYIFSCFPILLGPSGADKRRRGFCKGLNWMKLRLRTRVNFLRLPMARNGLKGQVKTNK